MVPSSISPDGKYGVTAFDNSIYPIPLSGKIDPNELIDLHTGRILWSLLRRGMIHMNRGGIQPTRWSADDSLLLWEVEGRWSPAALTLVQVKESKIVSQLDLLEAAQKAILERTRRAAPERYLAAEKFNAGHGSAFPDGFNVNVRTEGDKPRGEPKRDIHGLPIALPLKVHAELTSNPKDIGNIGNAQLDSELDGVVTTEFQFQVTRFHLRDKPFPDATASSWLEMIGQNGAAKAPLDYGDVVTLRGRISTRADMAGHPVVVFILKNPVSILASESDPAVPAISEVQLIGLGKWGAAGRRGAEERSECEVSGTVQRSQRKDRLSPISLIVSGYGYGY